MTFGRLSSIALIAGVAFYAALYVFRPGWGSLVAALAGPLALVASLLAFIWGFMGVFRDKNRLPAVAATLISGAVNAFFFYEIFT